MSVYAAAIAGCIFGWAITRYLPVVRRYLRRILDRRQFEICRRKPTDLMEKRNKAPLRHVDWGYIDTNNTRHIGD